MRDPVLLTICNLLSCCLYPFAGVAAKTLTVPAVEDGQVMEVETEQLTWLSCKASPGRASHAEVC